MSIESPEDLERLREIGRIVGLTIQEVRKYVRPGITTAELDAVGDRFLTAHGANPAPRQTYNFPGAIMICVNDEAVHSVPGERRIEAGWGARLAILAAILAAIALGACGAAPARVAAASGTTR